MPNYFADYDTTVNFISEEELLRDHSGMECSEGGGFFYVDFPMYFLKQIF